MYRVDVAESALSTCYYFAGSLALDAMSDQFPVVFKTPPMP